MGLSWPLRAEFQDFVVQPFCDLICIHWNLTTWLHGFGHLHVPSRMSSEMTPLWRTPGSPCSCSQAGRSLRTAARCEGKQIWACGSQQWPWEKAKKAETSVCSTKVLLQSAGLFFFFFPIEVPQGCSSSLLTWEGPLWGSVAGNIKEIGTIPRYSQLLSAHSLAASASRLAPCRDWCWFSCCRFCSHSQPSTPCGQRS